jgi:hypothetical protein
MIAFSGRARRTITGFLLCGALALGPAVADEAGSGPKATETLSHDEALSALGAQLASSVLLTQSDPSIPEILAALDNNIAAARRIRELVTGQQKVTDKQIGEIAKQVSEIAESFRQIADLAPGVFQRRKNELSNIGVIGQEMGFRLAHADARVTELKNNNEGIQKRLKAEGLVRTEIEKLRLTQQANDAEIHSLEAAIAAWNYFAGRHYELSAKLAEQSADLDVFFHALKENARVYKAAARTLNMANSVKLALNELDSIQNLDALQAQLVQSWGDLMKIVDQVNNGLILKPGM